jgi:hypothetical protein
MERFLSTLSIAAAVFFAAVTPVLAQSLGNQPDPIQFLVAPEVPAPGDTVLIEVQGVGNFLGEATITWQVDGKTIASGLGERTFSFTAGGLGSKTSVKAIIDSPTKGVITKNFTFLPSVVNMVWEADTSVPPWFKGKALYSAGSSLTITAFPQVILNGKTVTSNNLSFQWKRNETPLTQSSGKGRNQITFKGNQLLPTEEVSVEVYAGSAILARGAVTVPAYKPQVVLYERDPLRGVLYDQTFSGSVSLSETEITVQAAPYYFANSSIINGTAPYVWTLNGDKAEGPQTASGILTLRQSGSGAGRAQLEVSVQNNDSDKYVQSAKTAIQILFGGASNSPFSNFFGL